MDEGSGEESQDSISRPEYEELKIGGGASTLMIEVLGDEKMSAKSAQVEEIEERIEAEESDIDEEDDDYEEVKNEEHTVLKGNEKRVHADATNLSFIQKVDDTAKNSISATLPVQQQEQREERLEAVVAVKQPHYVLALTDGKGKGKSTHSTPVTDVPITPIQIIAAPKMLSAKTKDNKLLLVQMVSDTVKPLTVTSLPSAVTAISEKQNSIVEKYMENALKDAAPQAQQNVLRSSTPLSREFLALQKSVNESKVLSEFVTDVRMRNSRKSGNVKEESDMRRMHLSVSATEPLAPPSNQELARRSNSAEKRRKFAPLRDDHNLSDYERKLHRRSRSKSVNRKSPVAQLDSSSSRLKRWPSDEKILKRTNMRSQNSEFVQKQMDFLNRVMSQQRENEENSDSEYFAQAMVESVDDENSNGHDGSSIHESGCSGQFGQKQLDVSASSDSGGLEDSSLEAHLKEIWQPPPKRGWDSFCWKCRECGDLIPCAKCVRCFHTTCIKVNASTKLDSSWTCPECIAMENVLNSPRRARRNDLSLDLLSQLLSFALKRMRIVKGFTKTLFSNQELPCYSKYIINPVTFSSLQDKIEKRVFRCAEEFVNETKWMLHNALILSNGITNSKEVLSAKSIVKVCRQESTEIDTCAECYLNANTRADWFVDVCTQPHLLLWAKLKGFPYWPAKAMGPGQGALVNVRFFGEHDRAFVPVKDCFLYSEQDPNTQTGKRSARELADCIKEVEVHIEQIKEKVGDFRHAVYKTPYDPAEELMQLEFMMPGVTEYMNRQQQALTHKPPLQYKIVKTADNNLSIIKKATASESGNDSDPATLCSSSKKQEIGGEGSKSKSMNSNSSPSTSKYEVVCKVSSDDSNSSKLSTVILKRKSPSVGEDHTKESDLAKPYAPKITKVEIFREGGPKVSGNTSSGAKRRHGNEGTDEDAVRGSKHSKHNQEPGLPLLTIKTKNAKPVAEQQPQAPSLRPPLQKERNKETCAEDNQKAQSMVEQLVKHKQGVTIKKISKEHKKNSTGNSGSNNSSNNSNSTASPPQTVPVVATQPNEKLSSTAAGQNSAAPVVPITKKDEKSPKSANAPFILKDLVPFVEIKKEIPSDDEESGAGSQDLSSKKSKELATLNFAAAKSTDTNMTTRSQSNATNDTAATSADQNNVAAASQASQDEPSQFPNLLTVVKQEVMSDEEEVQPTTTAASSHPSKESASTQKGEKNVLTANATLMPVVTDAVRVVGDTTIQRISTKNAQPATLVPQPCQTVAAQSAPLTTSSSKRASHGVPYGPLPEAVLTANAGRGANAAGASHNSVGGGASTKSKSIAQSQIQLQHIEQQLSQIQVQMQAQQTATTLQQQQQMHQGQRARKSFPNRSPTTLSPTRNGGTTVATSSPLTTVGLANLPLVASNVMNAALLPNDIKRSLLKTNMVAIPVDVAASRSSNTIPVPPLTAVSKTTLPQSTVTASAINAPLPAVTLGTSAPTVTTNLSNCNGSGNSSSNSSNMSNNNSAVLLSTPPPLAGLSMGGVTNVVPSSIAPVVTTAATLNATAIATTTITTAATLSSNVNGSNNSISTNNSNNDCLLQGTAASVDSHFLGDYVTPTMASAITEVICRGPPKMIARPSGPLQSDGGIMFPSQAGPVCRTLVENAHKLTDFFISVMEDTMCEMSVGDDSLLQAKITLLTLELERTKQAYEHDISELKRTSDLMLCEMRKSMEGEKTRFANEIRKQCEQERLRSVEETKKKQWCANCGREAQFYCCWNTSYCDYPCQQLHWSRHASSCAQTRPASNETANSNATTGSNSSTSQQERQYGSFKNANNFLGTTSTTGTQYSKTVMNNKKDKHNNKSGSISGSSGNSASITAIPASNAAATPTEVLKLPSNTYLRPVTASGGNTNSHSSNSLRAPTYAMPMPVPVQRFNIPLPITAAVNSAPPYTIVQRGNNWELMSTARAAVDMGAPSLGANNVGAITAPLVSVSSAQQQQQHQARLNTSNKSSNSRNRATAANSMNSLALNSTALQCGSGAVMRPTQM